MKNNEFAHYYARRRQALDVLFKDDEFLYPNNEPWPESSFDYPYGQAPTVSNIPPEEAADWSKNVGQYYFDNAVGSSKHPTPFGIKSAEFARDRFEKNGITGYSKLSDELFLELICEGLYSKYLGPLDPQDEKLFGVSSDDNYQYLKSDQSCMKVVKKPWDGEYVAPAIAIVRRKLPLAQDESKWNYELVAIALAALEQPAGKDGEAEYVFSEKLVFDAKNHQSSSAWWLAKFYVLQGAIHRINLIDHIKVHFPSDTMNAITKSALPRWHPIQQLLLPHFRLTLPVNNAVLEGERSIINRDTWYPWSPVTANGEEIRKLIPFSWGGSRYYWDEKNSSYTRYAFSLDPDSVMDPDAPDAAPIPSFIGLQASRYGEFLSDYFASILKFTTEVIAETLDDPAPDFAQSDLNWLEIQRWAHEISELVPGFPNATEINDKETLARTCAVIIWNAAIVHSSDHCTLHMMIDKYPVPFILRVRPPADNAAETSETIAEALGEKGMKYLTGAVSGLEDILKNAEHHTWWKEALINFGADTLIDKIGAAELKEGTVPLCWPTDLVYTKMADLLFYRPHSSSLLYDCPYEFLVTEDQLSKEMQELNKQWQEAGRPIVTEKQKKVLAKIRKAFQHDLESVNAKYYDKDGLPTIYKEENPDFKPTDIPCPMNQYGFPKLIPGEGDKDKERPDMEANTRMECCFTAGIQY